MAYRTPESALADRCVEWMDAKIKEGAPLYYEHRSGSGGFSYKKGVPDLFAVANGHHLEIELKAPGGRLSPMQEKFKWRCEAQWHIPHCVPKTLEEFVEFVSPYLEA